MSCNHAAASSSRRSTGSTVSASSAARAATPLVWRSNFLDSVRARRTDTASFDFGTATSAPVGHELPRNRQGAASHNQMNNWRTSAFRNLRIRTRISARSDSTWCRSPVSRDRQPEHEGSKHRQADDWYPCAHDFDHASDRLRESRFRTSAATSMREIVITRDQWKVQLERRFDLVCRGRGYGSPLILGSQGSMQHPTTGGIPMPVPI